MELQLVGDGDVFAILGDGDGQGALAEFFAVGDDALGQLVRLREGVPLAPFDGLAVACRQGLGLAQLAVDGLVPGVFQQLRVVERLHGGGHARGLDAGVGVDLARRRVDDAAVCKALQVIAKGLGIGMIHMRAPF